MPANCKHRYRNWIRLDTWIHMKIVWKPLVVRIVKRDAAGCMTWRGLQGRPAIQINDRPRGTCIACGVPVLASGGKGSSGCRVSPAFIHHLVK